MFNVSIREYFSVLNVFIVCIRNTTVFKLIPLLCTHGYSYMFSTVHPPRHEVNGQPLQQMPGLEIKSDMISGKSIPYLENGDEDVSLTNSEVRMSPIRNFMMRPTVGD